MTQPQPDECSTCTGYDSSTCPICRGTGEQPAQPFDLDTIQQDARLITAIQHEADTTPATYQANHQLHSPRLLAAGHRLIARVRELEQQLAASDDLRQRAIDKGDEDRARIADLERDLARLQRDYAAEERLHAKTIAERDRASDYADRLADRLAPADVTGEHSDSNCPWQNALDYDGPPAARARDGR